MILDEYYLISEFKFGFELEAIRKNGDIENFNDVVLSDMIDAFKIDISKYNKGSFKYTKLPTEVVGVQGVDGSVQPDDEGVGFEWSSPVFTATPFNIKRVVDGLDKLMSFGYYTNESCGFHVHFSFPNISKLDSAWLISKLSLDDEMIEKFTSFMSETTNGYRLIDFQNEQYASSDFLYAIRECFARGDMASLKDLINTDKYRVVRLHPQGTIEWRGPRGFLNDYEDKNIIKDFFKQFLEIIHWVSRTLAEKDIDGYNKDTFFKMIYGDDFKEEDIIKGFKYKDFVEKIHKLSSKMIETKTIIPLQKFADEYLKTKSENTLFVILELLSNLFYESKPFFYDNSQKLFMKYANSDDFSTLINALYKENVHPNGSSIQQIVLNSMISMWDKPLFKKTMALLSLTHSNKEIPSILNERVKEYLYKINDEKEYKAEKENINEMLDIFLDGFAVPKYYWGEFFKDIKIAIDFSDYITTPSLVPCRLYVSFILNVYVEFRYEQSALEKIKKLCQKSDVVKNEIEYELQKYDESNMTNVLNKWKKYYNQNIE